MKKIFWTLLLFVALQTQAQTKSQAQETFYPQALVELYSSEGCGCKSNIALLLKEKEVKVLLAGNMGNGAYLNLNNAGIRVYRGCSGDASQLVKAYIQGDVIDSGNQCNHNHEHSGEHECSHS